MNNQVHPKLRPFINWFAPIDADNVKLGHALRESANDGEPNNEPKSQRPCGCDANQGARHETATASEPNLNPGRRPQMHHGLTQQATNNTCVTARRDEHFNGEPAYIRMPELDRRVAWGDDCNAAAWFDTAKRKAVYLCVNYEPNAQRWLPIVERAETPEGAQR